MKTTSFMFAVLLAAASNALPLDSPPLSPLPQLNNFFPVDLGNSSFEPSASPLPTQTPIPELQNPSLTTFWTVVDNGKTVQVELPVAMEMTLMALGANRTVEVLLQQTSNQMTTFAPVPKTVGDEVIPAFLQKILDGPLFGPIKNNISLELAEDDCQRRIFCEIHTIARNTPAASEDEIIRTSVLSRLAKRDPAEEKKMLENYERGSTVGKNGDDCSRTFESCDISILSGQLQDIGKTRQKRGIILLSLTAIALIILFPILLILAPIIIVPIILFV